MGYLRQWLTALISLEGVVWKIEYRNVVSLIIYKVKLMEQDVRLSCD